MEDVTHKKKKYPLLSSVMKAVLIIFHSNADCERVFSIVGKNKTKDRSLMKTDTLSALMTHRLAMESRATKCFSTCYTSDMLKRAKKATYEALHS